MKFTKLCVPQDRYMTELASRTSRKLIQQDEHWLPMMLVTPVRHQARPTRLIPAEESALVKNTRWFVPLADFSCAWCGSLSSHTCGQDQTPTWARRRTCWRGKECWALRLGSPVGGKAWSDPKKQAIISGVIALPILVGSKRCKSMLKFEEPQDASGKWRFI